MTEAGQSLITTCQQLCNDVQDHSAFELRGMVQGLVLHDVCYEDAGKLRPVVHRASLVEMIVPVRRCCNCCRTQI